MSLIKILNNKGPSIEPWGTPFCISAQLLRSNPDKFQAIAVGNKTHAKTPVFKIESAEITCDEVVKLLGIDIDYQLNFNYHIKNIFSHNYHLHKTRCYRQHNYTMYHIQ
jgi:hypothetical protein